MKTPLDVAAEIYGLDPRRYGDTSILKFPFVAPGVAAGATSDVLTVTTITDRLLLALAAQPSDGAAASYAGLELEFQYGDRFFATDGKVSQFVPLSLLSGRGPGPSQAGGPWYSWEVPILLPANTVLAARIRNNTAGPLVPSVALKTVELRAR